MVKIKCPNCGAVLTVKEVPGLKDKSVRCPICDESRPFSNYKEVVPVAHDDTVYASSQGKRPGNDDVTEINIGSSTTITHGVYILDKATNKEYALQDGVNYVGRKAASTPAKVNVQIETADMGFSRAHLCIEVVRLANGICKYKVYNDACKNPTFVNGEKIGKDDIYLLKDKDIIKSSTVELQFLLK